jgi:hypothetical protein
VGGVHVTCSMACGTQTTINIAPVPDLRRKWALNLRISLSSFVQMSTRQLDVLLLRSLFYYVGLNYLLV